MSASPPADPYGPVPASGVSIARVEPAELALLERLHQLMSHDISQSWRRLPDADGLFTTRHLHEQLDDPTGQVDLVRRDGNTIGFVGSRHIPDLSRRRLSLMFIVRAARHRGVGLAAAAAHMRATPGPWEIGFQDYNPDAAGFWPEVARHLSGNDWTYERRPVPDKPHIPFDTFIVLSVTATATADN
jgi:predicted acetyltransferase